MRQVMPDPSSSSAKPSESAALRQEILEAQVAIDQGDYKTVRRKLNRLTDPSMLIPAEIKPEVARLEKSVKADPVAMVLAGSCLVFFALVVWHYVL